MSLWAELGSHSQHGLCQRQKTLFSSRQSPACCPGRTHLLCESLCARRLRAAATSVCMLRSKGNCKLPTEKLSVSVRYFRLFRRVSDGSCQHCSPLTQAPESIWHTGCGNFHMKARSPQPVPSGWTRGWHGAGTRSLGGAKGTLHGADLWQRSWQLLSSPFFGAISSSSNAAPDGRVWTLLCRCPCKQVTLLISSGTLFFTL